MKRLGVREFRDHATKYLGGDEALAIERHGQTIGFYIPAGANWHQSFTQALERLEETVRRVLAEADLSEEELSRLYDPKESLPEQPRQRRGRVA